MKDPTLTSWVSQLVLSTTSEISNTEAFVLFSNYMMLFDDTDCGVIKMPHMMRLAKKSDK